MGHAGTGQEAQESAKLHTDQLTLGAMSMRVKLYNEGFE